MINEEDELFPQINADLNHFNEIYPQFKTDEQSNYYDINTFNESIHNVISDLAIIHLNIRSLSANFDHVYALFQMLDIKFDIICFTESWLTESTKSLYEFPNYQSFHSLRGNKRGGGVSVYVHDTLRVEKLSHISVSLPNIESLFLKIFCESKQTTVGTIYKPPSATYIEFTDSLENLVLQVTRDKLSETILCGDFNLNLLNSDNDAAPLYFVNCMSTLSLIPVITKPTRITNSPEAASASLIDNIFTTAPYNFQSGIIISDISDHFPIFYIRKKIAGDKFPNNTPQSTVIKYRNFNDQSLDALRHDLSNQNFQSVVQNSNPDDAIKEFSDILYTSYNNCCPIKTKTLSRKAQQKPWITNTIFSNMKKRDAYHSLWLQNKIEGRLFPIFRNRVTNEIQSSKRRYFKEKFNSFRDNTRATWNLINKILRPQGSTSKKNSITAIVHDDERYDNNSDIANIFNEFFVNIGKSIAESCSPSQSHPLHFMQGDYPNSFFLEPIAAHDVKNCILALKDKKCDVHSIPVRVLKCVSDNVSPILASVINRSFESGASPHSLKIARVIPIPKTGEVENINNYRPISILPLLSKLFEKIAYKNWFYKDEIYSTLLVQ